MDTNPHLTSLPIPKPDLLAPKDLDQTTGTASIFRLPEVRAAIRGDFVVLPCDLVCETGGEQMVESWLINQTGDAIANSIGDDGVSHMNRNDSAQRRLHGGISVYYNTKDNLSAKGEETDFIATSSAELDAAAPRSSVPSPLSKLLYSVPKDTLNDITDAKKSFPIRHSLLRSHPRLRLQSSHRDAHLYILPYWVLDMIDKNEHMDSLGEDAIGWWAKAGWQEGLATKLGLESILLATKSREGNESPTDINHDIDDCHVRDKSTTWTTEIPRADLDPQDKRSSLVVPPLLAYFHSSKTTADDNASQSILRRVDTAPLLLNISLALAKLESIEESGKQASALAHQSKIAYPAGIAARTTITRADCLLAENVTVEEKSAIKECVIGANCQIKTGAKLTRCVLMEGVVVGKGCKLTGCILGKRSEVGEECVLVDCEVQENLLIEARSKLSRHANYLSYWNLANASDSGRQGRQAHELRRYGSN